MIATLVVFAVAGIYPLALAVTGSYPNGICYLLIISIC